MSSVLVALLQTLRTSFRTRAALEAEILALRHQLQVLQRSRPRQLRLTRADRVLWVWFSRIWSGWRTATVLVKPATVIAWHRQGFRLFWTWKSRHRLGRPSVPAELRSLIRTMSDANPFWGAPRIHGELLKLGIDVSQATVAKYMSRRRRPPSPTWRAFLANHAAQIIAADFFVVPTVRYRLLFVLVILSLDRRRLVHVAVTAHPTSAWTAQQLREAFPNNEAPRFLLHDHDSAFAAVHLTVGGMGIRQLRTAPVHRGRTVTWNASWLHPARVSRPRHRAERSRLATSPRAVRGVLPELAHAPRAREGHPDLSARLRRRIDH
jgi:hypothetical protein